MEDCKARRTYPRQKKQGKMTRAPLSSKETDPSRRPLSLGCIAEAEPEVTDRVETPKQLAERVGVSNYQIRQLLRTGELEHVPICGRKFIPSGAWSRYLEANTKGGKRWQDEAMVQDYATSKIAEPTISPGQSTVAAASSRQAQRTAKRSEHLRGMAASQKAGSRPSDPAQALVTDILADYITERGPKVVGQETMARAVETLARTWEGRTAAGFRPSRPYVKRRDRAVGTVRRELGVLQAAINFLTSAASSPAPWLWSFQCPPPKERWLTRDEAARLIRASRKDRKARLYMPLFILIGIYTGRRKEAILSLAGRRST